MKSSDPFHNTDAMDQLMDAYDQDETAAVRRLERVERMLARLEGKNCPDLVQRLKTVRLDRWADAVLDSIENQIPKA